MNEATATITPAPQEIKLTPAEEARFWSKVDKINGPTMPHMESPCWLWTAYKSRKGYGQFGVGRKMRRTHRIAWSLVNGPVPYNDSAVLCVCHRCDNTACCRSDHLFLGTNAANMADRESKGRSNLLPARLTLKLHPEKLAHGNRNGAYTKPEKVRRGEVHGMAKLNDAKIIEIRVSYAAGGTTQRRLAAQFGVDQALIGLIINRKIWRHVP